MGHYTEFRFKAKLKATFPPEGVDLFRKFIVNHNWEWGANGEFLRPSISHGFFDCPRWSSLLISRNGRDDLYNCEFTINPDGSMFIGIHTEFKNYDEEINLFLDWISPYIDTNVENENLGWILREDDDQSLQIIFDACADLRPPGRGFDCEMPAAAALPEHYSIIPRILDLPGRQEQTPGPS